MKFVFEKSAVFAKDYPQKLLPEVGIVGRSNSGKSSLVNSWTQARLAKISGQPGKTRLLNFFIAAGKYRLVDMPGYGFSKRTKAEHKMWQEMIETYISLRADLKGLLLIMDIRREWEPDEQLLVEWAQRNGKPVFVVLNKVDKVTQSEKYKSIKNIESLGIKPFVISAKTGKGVDQLIQTVWQEWVVDTEAGL